MIKAVHINSPKPLFKGEIEFCADAAHSLRAFEITDILEAVVAGKLGRLGLSAMLAIASFIIHYLDLQAANNFGSFAPYTDYPLTGLLPRNEPTGISRP